MADVSGRRCDIELIPQWGRMLRDGKELDYPNQLSLFNALIVLKDSFLEVCSENRKRGEKLGLLHGPINELAGLCRSYEMSGMMDNKRVYSVLCEIASDMESVTDA